MRRLNFSIDLIKLPLKYNGMESLTALADPTRRQIVELLSAGEKSAGDVAGAFDISPPAISQHLKVLRDAGLVQVRAEAQRRIYSLDRAGFDEVEAWLAKIRRFWASRLDALERELRKPEPTQRKRSKR